MAKREKPIIDEFNTRLASGYRDPSLTSLRLAPIVPVTSTVGKFMKFGADMYQIYNNLKRAMTAPRLRIDSRVHSAGYTTEEFSVEMPIYDKEINGVPDRNRELYKTKKIRKALSAIQLGMVYALVDFLRNTANYDPALVYSILGVNRWTDKVNSNPYTDLVNLLQLLHGRIPGSTKDLSVGIASKPWNALMQHPHTFERSKVWGIAPSEELVARIIGAKEVFLLEDQKSLDIDDETDEATFVDLWNDEVVVNYQVTDPDPMFTDALSLAIARIDGNPVVHEPYREPRVKADIHAVDDEWGLVDISKKRRVIATTVTGT